VAFNLLQHDKPGRAHRLLHVALLVLVAWSLGAWAAARSLITRAELARADALVVFSGGSVYRERALWAAHLYREGRAPRIILTDDGLRGPWSFTAERNPTYAELEAEELHKAGVPLESIEILPQQVSSTYHEVALLRTYAAAQNLRSLLFVTSPYHSRRALWTLKRLFEGSNVLIGLEAPPTGEQSPAPLTWWWSARGWRSVAAEYPKFIYYWLHYR
jgi:uncharacterized SAM-binding protein YcdF (DUF218 family)